MTTLSPAPPAPDAAPATGGYLRLSSCSECGSRRRILVEVAGELRGHCVGCGADLALPLGTEPHRMTVVTVGRGGQGIVEVAGSE
ncbi:MAG TPA: hypothetical protein VH134_14545 [Candidatus Dormibacteraeota bacterium]|nr:hypothetical protein [Candidatus Dormibacteraeota bacterium]